MQLCSPSALHHRSSAASPSAGPVPLLVPICGTTCQVVHCGFIFFNLVDGPPASMSSAGLQGFCLQAEVGLSEWQECQGAGLNSHFLFLV